MSHSSLVGALLGVVAALGASAAPSAPPQHAAGGAGAEVWEMSSGRVSLRIRDRLDREDEAAGFRNIRPIHRSRVSITSGVGVCGGAGIGDGFDMAAQREAMSALAIDVCAGASIGEILDEMAWTEDVFVGSAVSVARMATPRSSVLEARRARESAARPMIPARDSALESGGAGLGFAEMEAFSPGRSGVNRR